MERVFPLRRLGKSDLMVSAVGLGCWQFSKGHGLSAKFWPILRDEEIHDIVRISLEGGINWFDTAEAYGGGESERALSKALESIDGFSEDVIIATKWRPFFRTAKSLLTTIDRRLANLAVQRIDLHQVHNPYSFSSTRSEMQAMAQLVKSGKVRYVGVSNFSAENMRKAQDELSRNGLNLTANQVHYSLLHRRIEKNGVLDTAKELGISIIAYSPLEQGLLTGKFHDDPSLIQNLSGFRRYRSEFKPRGLEKSRPLVHALKELAGKHGATAAQIALNWLISHSGDLVVAIPGATKAQQAGDNAGSLKFRLSQDELEYLGRISAREG